MFGLTWKMYMYGHWTFLFLIRGLTFMILIFFLLNTWTHLDSNVEESDRVEVERFQQQDKLNYQLSTKN